MRQGKMLAAMMALEIYAKVFSVCPKGVTIDGRFPLEIPTSARDGKVVVAAEGDMPRELIASKSEVDGLVGALHPECAKE
jgi:hypothetical protein